MTGTAKTFYSKALQINPQHQETYVNLGMIAELEGNFAEAQQNYLKAASLNGSSAYAHYCLAMLYERMDLFDEAIAAYDDALHGDPNYLKALFNVARLYHTQGDYAQAIQYFERAYNSLGLIYEEMGKWPEAILAFQKSSERDMFFPEAHLNLARVLYHYHSSDLSPDLAQQLIERLQMVLCSAPEDEASQPIRQRIESFLEFLASTMEPSTSPGSLIPLVR
jgi:tetratricopeptide (TPR) repeat protein